MIGDDQLITITFDILHALNLVRQHAQDLDQPDKCTESFSYQFSGRDLPGSCVSFEHEHQRHNNETDDQTGHSKYREANNRPNQSSKMVELPRQG